MRKNGHFRPHNMAMAGWICGSENEPKSSSVDVLFVPKKNSLRRFLGEYYSPAALFHFFFPPKKNGFNNFVA